MEKVTIGRDSNSTIVIEQSHGRVSNDHADIEMKDGQLIFIDHSSNGSLVNGKMIHNESIAVRNGDIISLANSYVLSWPVILSHFPELQRKTERFDGSNVIIEQSVKRTELLQSTEGNDGQTTTFDPQIRHNSGGENVTIGQLNEFTQADIDEYLDKFNLGAFLSSWVWSLKNGIYWPLLIIPISLIPYVGQVCSLFLCTYLGICGYKKAWQTYKGSSFSKFIDKQRKWVILGCVLFPVFAIVQFIAIYYILIEI